MTWLNASHLMPPGIGPHQVELIPGGKCGVCFAHIYADRWRNCGHVRLYMFYAYNSLRTLRLFAFADSIEVNENGWVFHPASSRRIEGVDRMDAVEQWMAFNAAVAATREVPQCYDCGSTHRLTTVEGVGDYRRDLDYVTCRGCAEMNPCILACTRCGELRPTRDALGTISTGEGDLVTVCEDCQNDEQWQLCSHCSVYTMTMGADIECCETDDHGIVAGCQCYSCRRNRANRPSYINNYSYRPELRFLTVGGETRYGIGSYGSAIDRTTYLGFELEVEVHRNNDLQDVAKMFKAAIGEDFYLKSDGSIGHGFEIVSHPMTLEYAMAKVNWRAFREFRKDGRIYSADNCGMHVHVSKAAFSSKAHEYRWMLFFHRNRLTMQTIAGRESSYARFDNTNRANLARVVKDRRNRVHRETERYSAINMLNDETYEVRIFESSVYVNRVQAYLQLVDATVEYTRHLVSSKVMRDGGFNFGEFRVWLSANRSRYAQLIQRIEATVDDAVYTKPLTEQIYGFEERFINEYGYSDTRRVYKTRVIQEI